MNKKFLLSSLGIILVILLAVGGYYFFNGKNDSVGFTINNIVLKTQIIENQSLQTSFKITNLLNERAFNISSLNLDEVMQLTDSEVLIGPEETKEIIVNFKGVSTGVHSGAIVVKTNSGEKLIPVIVSVSTKDPLFFTIIDEDSASKDIAPGSKSNIKIKLYNILDNTPHAVKLVYLIKDLKGNIISEETENNVVAGSETSFTKTISISQDLAYGNYVYGVVTEYGNSISTSTYLFDVADESLIGSKFDVNSFTILFSIVVLVFLFGIIVLFIVMIRERDKLFVDLRAQHKDEIKIYSNLIEKKSAVSVSKAKTEKEKKLIVEKYREMKRKALKSLEEKHQKQIENLKKLRKTKKTDEVKKQVQEWKKQGYNVQELTGLSVPEKKDMSDLLKEWKKQGYDTAVIGK